MLYLAFLATQSGVLNELSRTERPQDGRSSTTRPDLPNSNPKQPGDETLTATANLDDIRERVSDIAAIIWGLAAADSTYRDGVTDKEDVDQFFNGACGIVSAAQRAISNLQKALGVAPEGYAA